MLCVEPWAWCSNTRLVWDPSRIHLKYSQGCCSQTRQYPVSVTPCRLYPISYPHQCKCCCISLMFECKGGFSKHAPYGPGSFVPVSRIGIHMPAMTNMIVTPGGHFSVEMILLFTNLDFGHCHRRQNRVAPSGVGIRKVQRWLGNPLLKLQASIPISLSHQSMISNTSLFAQSRVIFVILDCNIDAFIGLGV